VASGLVVPGRHAKLVTSPRGTLSPWALQRSRHRKALLKPLQWRALERADLLHATSDMELAEIRNLNLSAPVAVVPNGIDIPESMDTETPSALRTLLFLSRIHPKKGIDRLLQAWQSLQNSHPEWRLSIVGRGEPQHVEQVMDLATELKLDRVDFSGPVYGSARTAAYRSADLFVLPSHSENFGMVVAEALAHGRAVVASKGTPWQAVEREACGWWAEHDVDSLVAVLDRAMRLPRAELMQMGSRGRLWMQREFSWESVAEQLEAAYRWVLGGPGAPPPCVRIG
jgi:glycosyltransferase involved in cell wall biosynthesis